MVVTVRIQTGSVVVTVKKGDETVVMRLSWSLSLNRV
jgi:hypothetical protein